MNIMVLLKNIRRENNNISADYYPEGNSPKGFMKLQIATGSILEHDNASGFAAAHVRTELQRLAKAKSIPSEKTVMWY